MPPGSTSLTLHRPLSGLASIKVWLGGEAGLKINVADACDPQRVAATALGLEAEREVHAEGRGRES